MGCHFENLDEPHNTDNYFFLLNGSRNETAIQFLEMFPFVGKDIGKTVASSGSILPLLRVIRCVDHVLGPGLASARCSI